MTMMIQEVEKIEESFQHPFCVLVFEKRKELGLSAKALGDKIGGVSKSYIRHIELGRGAISVEPGMAICQILDIPIHLCLDYIAAKEIDRIKRRVKKEYNEWLDYVPGNVLKKMLDDEKSLETHQLFTGDKDLR